MVVIIKYYLVDSENVNDNWLMLLDLSDETDKIIVFYTKNSPHMPIHQSSNCSDVLAKLNLKNVMREIMLWIFS